MYVSALSLWQPWATLLVMGIKTFETRSWETSHRGPILIHAGKAKTQVGRSFFYELQARKDQSFFRGISFDELPFGAFIGGVSIAGCTDTTELLESGIVDADSDEFLMGDYSADRFGWTCVNPKRITRPIKWSGRQRIFNASLDVSAELRAAVASLGMFSSLPAHAGEPELSKSLATV